MYITIKNNLISVYSLKKEIGIDDINIYFNGKQLEDNRTLFEYNIKKNDRVEVVKKNRGGRLNGLQIFGYVVLLLVYVFIIMTGLIPFISFIISNIIVKSLIFIFDFIIGWIDPNNWIHSLIDFIKGIAIPFIKFILDFTIIFLTIYLLTFICVYQLYKAKWGDQNVCQAFKNSSTLAFFMTVFMILFYSIANLPTFIERILTPILPSFLAGILSKVISIFYNIRGRLIRLMPGSDMAYMITDILTTGISTLSKYSYLIEESLKNYIEFYKRFMSNPQYKEKILEYKVKPILDLILRVESFESGKYDLSTNTIQNTGLKTNMTTILNNETSRKQYAYTYITRSIYQSILYVFSKIIYIFDICDATDEEKATVEANIRHIDNILDDIQSYINETTTKQGQTTNPVNDDGINFNVKIEKSKKVIDYYRKIISNLKAGEEGRTKMVVVDCIFTILDNGIATAFPMTLLFIIFFLIFMFIPVGF
jgi:hypothetical protein